MQVKIEYVLIPLLVVIYFSLPRYQVHYYKFFQQVVAAEDSTKQRLKEDLSDDQYLDVLTRNYDQWDQALNILDGQKNVPEELAMDTFKLRRYIMLRKQENVFRKTIIQRESYIYLDSVAHVQELMTQYLNLDYGLSFRVPTGEEPVSSETASDPRMIKVLYNRDWVEIPYEPAAYHRIGFRDSLGRWDGMVRDYYDNGTLQMKGTYKQNKRDGVFLYYSDHNTYSAAGRYRNDRNTGKWETFHDNGRLASEVYYNNGYFLKNLWDSLGNHLVVNGQGKEIQRYGDGVIAVEGEYRNGLKEGTWLGLHPNGELYFEEIFNRGSLVSGKSRTLAGETFVYDASSLFPMPEGGYQKFREYLKTETGKTSVTEMGHVKLSFRVTKDGKLADVNVEQHGTPELDEKAEEILLNGPAWLPARNHGHVAVEGWAVALVEFY